MGAWGLQKLRDRLALRERSGKTEDGAESWNEISRFHRTVENHAFANAGTQGHHPGGARERIAGAMVLEAIAAGIVVGVAAKVREDEKSGFAGVFGFGLDGFPDVGAEAISAADAVNIEGVSSGVGNIDIVHGDPEKARSHLAHQLAD